MFLPLASAKSVIEVERSRFTGSLEWNENGTANMRQSGPVKYVGEPITEINEAWEELLHRTFELLSSSAADT